MNGSGLMNFRDLGGIKTVDGKVIRKSRLLRSANLSKLTPKEVQMLKNLGLFQVVDFRLPSEVKLVPNVEIDGVTYLNVDVLGEKLGTSSTMDNWMSSLCLDNVDNEMMEVYRQFVLLPSAKTAFADFLNVCVNNCDKGAILFHCHAGKDRTGFAAALILKILGVDDEDILTDYLKTMENREWIGDQLNKYREKGLGEEQMAVLETVLGVKKEYLNAAFTTINMEYGCFENFLERELGITANNIIRLKQFYLETDV